MTVGGASFVGIIAAPWIVWLLNETLGQVLHYRVDLICALAALSISYALGEGLGRLACISFGCCYGKPLSESHPLLRRVLDERSFIFRGKTKKIAYAGHMDGVKVVPIQAITAILYVGAGLLVHGALSGVATTPPHTSSLWSSRRDGGPFLKFFEQIIEAAESCPPTNG